MILNMYLISMDRKVHKEHMVWMETIYFVIAGTVFHILDVVSPRQLKIKV